MPELPRFLTMAKGFSLLVLIGLWMHFPGLQRLEAQGGESGTVTITMVPGEYVPGRRPMGVGDPLTGLERVAREYERLHPQVRIQFRAMGGADLVEGEYIRTQIMGGIAPDIVVMNAEAVYADIDKGWWIPLNDFFDQPNPYSAPGEQGSDQWWNAFASPALTKARSAPDGRLYSLVFDLVETGIFYNRTLFRKYNLEVPRTWSEFLAVQKAFRQRGYVPFSASIQQGIDWAQDYLFDQMYFPIMDELDRVKGTPEEEESMQGYLGAKELAWAILQGHIAFDSPRYREMWRLMKEWRHYWPRDINQMNDQARMFLLQQSPMVWQASIFVRRLIYDDLVDFEWGVFYLPSVTSACSPMGEGVDPSVVGGAGIQYSVTVDAERRGNLEQVIDFLAFLSQPETGGMVVNEAGMYIPNFAGVEMKDFLEPFSEIIRYRYTSTKWIFTFDTRFNDTNRRLIELYLGDTLSLDEFMIRMDQNNREAALRYVERFGWTYEGAEWQVPREIAHGGD